MGSGLTGDVPPSPDLTNLVEDSAACVLQNTIGSPLTLDCNGRRSKAEANPSNGGPSERGVTTIGGVVPPKSTA